MNEVTHLPARKRDGREGWVRSVFEYRDSTEFREGLGSQIEWPDYLTEDERLFASLGCEVAMRLSREAPDEASRALWSDAMTAIARALVLDEDRNPEDSPTGARDGDR